MKTNMEEQRREYRTIHLYTDGGCGGNPGPGGYGIVLKCGQYTKEMSGGFNLTTNNRMELLAVILGLEAIKWENARVKIWSDSAYVVNAVDKGWLRDWVRKDFKGKKNKDLWKRFIPVYNKHRVTFHWIKGHAGHPENERCDTLAVAAYSCRSESGKKLPDDKGYLAEKLDSKGK